MTVQAYTVVKTRFSTYEINQEAKLIRRVTGERDPTQSQGKDGEFQPYYAISEIEVGQSLIIQYREGANVTITSPVVEVDGAWSYNG